MAQLRVLGLHARYRIVVLVLRLLAIVHILAPCPVPEVCKVNLTRSVIAMVFARNQLEARFHAPQYPSTMYTYMYTCIYVHTITCIISSDNCDVVLVQLQNLVDVSSDSVIDHVPYCPMQLPCLPPSRLSLTTKRLQQRVGDSQGEAAVGPHHGNLDGSGQLR